MLLAEDVLFEHRRRRRDAQCIAELFRVVDAERRPRSRALGRLVDERKSVLLRERPRVLIARHARMSRARQSRLGEQVFHARLVAKILRRLDAHAADAEALAHHRDWNLQLFVRGEQHVDAAEPRGNDSNAGTEAAPFRTLERAVDSANASGDAVTVYVAEGTYRLTRPLVFAPGGPAIEIRPVADANPVISGAVQITGWTLYDKNKNIYRASAGSNVSRQLYIDGRRATRARTDSPGDNIPAGFRPSPIVPPNNPKPVISGGIQYLPTSLNAAGWRDPAKWTHVRDIEAVIETQWKMMSVPLDAVTPSVQKKPGLVTLRQPGWTNANLYLGSTTTKADPYKCIAGAPGIWSLWQVTRFENAYEFLDQPGEWYLDRASGTIYYIPRPGENLSTADVELPVLETLIQAIGTPEKPVSGLRFEGLTFTYATWLGAASDDGYVADQSGFRVTGTENELNTTGHVQHVSRTPGNLRFEYAHNIVFTKNRVMHMGGAAVDFGAGSQDNVIT